MSQFSLNILDETQSCSLQSASSGIGLKIESYRRLYESETTHVYTLCQGKKYPYDIGRGYFFMDKVYYQNLL